jgi:large subunit ribosomal protein L25
MSDQRGQLTVNVRTQRGKGIARKLRHRGLIPGILYGRGVSGGESVMLSLSPLELQRAMDPQRLQNTFFELTLKQEGKPDVVQPCIITDAQRDAIRDDFVHVDFLRVDPEQPVTMKVPVEYVGRAAGVAAGGQLKTLRRFVRIAAKPAQVPVSVKVDVTPLQAGESLRFRDVALENATFAENPDVTIAVIETPKAAAPEKEVEEAKPAE